ncbi:hypothetical protein BGZ51_002205 [Haplosporangium sp. Z 767]|nr:hypothetical protein BGZ51_002205 [Haplosporangium sp. Z 767]KAF9187192.1 hypothetical protein BGZ50_002049 [Haplosporangium sp. Z 11]
MKDPTNLKALYLRTGSSITESAIEEESFKPKSGGVDHAANLPAHRPHFPPPSIFQRAHLKGILHRPSDAILLIRLYFAVIWSLFRLHFIELPYHILTRFKYSSKQHPASWPWLISVFFAVIRTCAAKMETIVQLRFIDHILELFLPLQAVLVKNTKITEGVKFKIKLDVLLKPERATLHEMRQELRQKGFSDNPLHPSQEYLQSMHPQGPKALLANMPEEVGPLDEDGTYTLHGEWIEALEDPKHPEHSRPRSQTVILYFHGGAYAFCSPKTHRHMLSNLAREVGPGTRIFSVDYRLAPEHPFPAAIHDAFAAYLYLTEPNHAALVLNEDSAVHELAVDPRDIVVAGDSAGGNLAAALMLYLGRYVQPSADPRLVMPHATLLLSPWTDITSSVPSAQCFDWYCYCPGPIGTSPIDKKAYIGFKKQNYASNYLCGDARLMLNSRNAFGIDQRWEWYSHLAQHPLVSPAHSPVGWLKELTNTLVQTSTHDRVLDDGRLYVHRIGMENPQEVNRIENYKDMVHVHQVLYSLFRSSRIAVKNLARFIERSKYLRDEREQKCGTVIESRSVLRKVSVRDRQARTEKKDKNGVDGDMTGHTETEYVPAFMQSSMVKKKAAADGVEWVMVEQDGREYAGDDGVPIDVLIRSWPLHEHEEREP